HRARPRRHHRSHRRARRRRRDGGAAARPTTGRHVVPGNAGGASHEARRRALRHGFGRFTNLDRFVAAGIGYMSAEATSVTSTVEARALPNTVVFSFVKG